MALYTDQFSTAHDLPGWEGRPHTRYVIASTPRCGSHRLGHALASTGALGFPLEYLNPVNLPAWEDRLGTHGPRDTLAALWRIRTSPNGCFGLKLHYRQLVSIAPALPPDDVLGGATVIRIRRRDLLGQAVSLTRARQTGVWIASQTPKREPFYDGDAIASALSDLAASNAGWDDALARAGIHPLPLTFEEITEDLDGAVSRVADHLGVRIDGSSSLSPPQPERQSDGLNAAWRERFLAEGRPILPPPPPPRSLRRHLGAALRRRLFG